MNEKQTLTHADAMAAGAPGNREAITSRVESSAPLDPFASVPGSRLRGSGDDWEELLYGDLPIKPGDTCGNSALIAEKLRQLQEAGLA